MRKNRITVKEAIRSIGAWSVAATLASMVFFVILLSIVFRILYRTSGENIILTGELQAIESSEQLDRYIRQATDTVRQVGVRIDAMLETGAGDQEIADYMTEVSGDLRNALNRDFTGVYGIIRGQNINGVGWVPYEGFDPVTRPWYRRASGAHGKPVLIEPYQDVLTGEMVITVAMALRDPSDVVALDITFPMLQEVREDLPGDDPARIDMILNEYGEVIFHTDPDQVGHNYRSEEGTLYAEVARILYHDDPGQTAFSCSFGGSEYEVCALPVDDWYSVSLINTHATYRRLHYLMSVSALILAVVIGFLLIILVNVTTKTILASRFNRQLSSLMDIYVTAYEIDLEEDSYERIYAEDKYADALPENGEHASVAISDVLTDLTLPISREAVLTFADLKTLKERLAKEHSVAIEFQGKSGRWRRARFVVSARGDDGLPARVLWLTEDIDVEKTGREELQDLSARAIAASEAKSDFLSQMSHHLRTPINMILGIDEMICRETDSETVMSYAGDIREAGLSLLSMVDELLDLSAIEDHSEAVNLAMDARYLNKNSGRGSTRQNGFTASTARILVADDTPADRQLFRRLLRQTLIRVDTAADAGGAVRMAGEADYDMIFLNQGMRGLREDTPLLESIRQAGGGRNAGTPAVCLSATVILDVRERIINAGYTAFLPKPVNPAALDKMLLAHLPAAKIVKTTLDTGEKEETAETEEFYTDERLGMLPGIDAAEGIAYCGSEDSYRQILRTFCGTLPGRINELWSSFDRRKWQEYGIVLHSIVNAARTIGARALGELGTEIEIAAFAEDEIRIRGLHPSLMTQLTQIRDALNLLFAKATAPREPVPDGDKETGERVARALSAAAHRMDMEAVEAQLALINEIRPEGFDDGILDRLRTCASEYDYDGILAVLNGSDRG